MEFISLSFTLSLFHSFTRAPWPLSISTSPSSYLHPPFVYLHIVVIGGNGEESKTVKNNHYDIVPGGVFTLYLLTFPFTSPAQRSPRTFQNKRLEEQKAKRQQEKGGAMRRSRQEVDKHHTHAILLPCYPATLPPYHPGILDFHHVDVVCLAPNPADVSLDR